MIAVVAGLGTFALVVGAAWLPPRLRREVATVEPTPLEQEAPSPADEPDWPPGQTVKQVRHGKVIERMSWGGADTPSEEDPLVQFLAQPAKPVTSGFDVQQTYSDGSDVDWSGPESAAAPAPEIDAVSSVSGTSTLTIVALVLGALGLIVGGRRHFRGAGPSAGSG
jgi:hypothetical protein